MSAIRSLRPFNRPGPTAAEQMRRHLAEYRAQGLRFNQAWTLSLARVKFESLRAQQEWLQVWEEPGVQEAWRYGYLREFHLPSLSFDQLAGMSEVVAYADARTVEPTLREVRVETP